MKTLRSKTSSILSRTLVALSMIALPATMSASTIFEANFNGSGSGTGGPSDIVQYGGTGSFVSNTDSTTTIESTPTMGQGNFVQVINGASTGFRIGRLADFTPASAGNSFAAMNTVGASTVSLHGGFDFFTRINSVSSGFESVQNWFRPFDVGSTSDGGIRLIFNTLDNNKLRLQVGTAADGISGAQASSLAFLDVDYTLYSGSEVTHHIGATFETNGGTGEVTMKVFGQQGTGAIDTSSGELGSLTFTIHSNVVTAGLPSGTFQMHTGWYGTANNVTSDIDYDALRMYDAMPSSFSAIPETNVASLLMGITGLLAGGIIVRRRRTR